MQATEGRLIGAVRNGSTVELYADFWRMTKPLVLPFVLIALVGALEILRPGLQLFAPLIWALFLIMFLLLLLLALVYVRRKPLLLLTPHEIVQNAPGGLPGEIKIQWSQIAKVDSLVTRHGTFVRLFVSDRRAFLSRFSGFSRQGLWLTRWILGSSYAPVMLDATHFRMTEAELTRLLHEFIPPHLFVPNASRESSSDIFWRAVRVFEPTVAVATPLAAVFVLSVIAVGALPAVSWPKFFGCVALAFVAVHVIFWAMFVVAMAIDFLFTRRCAVRA